MKSVDAGSAIILETRSVRKSPMQLSGTGLALVKDWTSKYWLPLNVQHHFRQTLRLFEEIVCLETCDCGESVQRIRLGDGNDIIGNRVNSEFTLIKILHYERVAELGDIHDSVDVLGDIGCVLQAQPVALSAEVAALDRAC